MVEQCRTCFLFAFLINWSLCWYISNAHQRLQVSGNNASEKKECSECSGFIGEFSCWIFAGRSMVMVKPTPWVSLRAIGLAPLLPIAWQLSSLRSSGDTHTHTSHI